MKLLKKSLVFCLISVSTVCFSEQIITVTDEPKDSFIDRKIDLSNQKILKQIQIDPNTNLLIDKAKIEITVKKDTNNKLNKLNSIIWYDVYVNGKAELLNEAINVQCPIIQTKFIDISEVPTKKIVQGLEISSYSPKSKIISKEVLDPGSYSFSTSSDEIKPIYHKNFNSNQMSVEVQVYLLCMQIHFAYFKQFLEERNRNITLKKFGLAN